MENRIILILSFFIFVSLFCTEIARATNCDITVAWSSNTTYIADQSNTYYCLDKDWLLMGVTAFSFAPGTQNSTLDCQNFNINGNNLYDTYGILLSGSDTKNISVKNCNITNFYNGIYISGSDNNNIIDNTVSKNSYGIRVLNGNYNDLIKNLVSGNGDGIRLENSNSNNLTDNLIYSNSFIGTYLYLSSSNLLTNNTINFNFDGVYLHSSSNNNVNHGSIFGNIVYDYYLRASGNTNNFSETNMTDAVKINYLDTSNWFMYNNETASNIWLNTNVDQVSAIERRISSWTQSILQWNDTIISGPEINAVYEITGLAPNKYYYVYNNSVLAYTLQTNQFGNLPSFTIYLGSEHEIKVEQYVPIQWSNLGLNATAIKMGDSVLLYSYWTTDSSLSFSILETNESGIIENKSAYGSPLVLSGSAEWSNYTWQNNSVASYTTIRWRVYANDTGDHWGTTDTMYFTVDPRIIITIESNKIISSGKIFSKPGSSTQINGKVFYSADSSTFSNQQLNFYYNGKYLGSNSTDTSGNYRFTLQFPYEGSYNFSVKTSDGIGNTGENYSVLLVSSKPTKVRFNLAYHLGSSKSNDNFTVYENSFVDSLSNAVNTTRKYICSSDSNQILSLINSGSVNYFFSSNLTQAYSSSDYLSSISNNLENSMLILAFTKGTCNKIEDRMYMVESNYLPSAPFSSFSFNIPKEYQFQIISKNDKIKLNGTYRFVSGDNQVCIRKSAIDISNIPIIDVSRC